MCQRNFIQLPDGVHFSSSCRRSAAENLWRMATNQRWRFRDKALGPTVQHYKHDAQLILHNIKLQKAQPFYFFMKPSRSQFYLAPWGSQAWNCLAEVEVLFETWPRLPWMRLKKKQGWLYTPKILHQMTLNDPNWLEDIYCCWRFTFDPQQYFLYFSFFPFIWKMYVHFLLPFLNAFVAVKCIL